MKNNIQHLTFTALMAAIICIAGPIVIPIGMVPMSLANMTIYLAVLLLDKKRAAISVAVYLLMGVIGLPVFSGFTGGVGKLFGPTGGYLIGYLVFICVAGSILEKEVISDRKTTIKARNIFKIIKQFFALIVGTLCLYFIGTLWLMYQSSLNFITALSIGVFPFVIFDIIKIVLAIILGNSVKRRIVFTDTYL